MAISSRKILITGASGFSGIHACQYAIRKGYKLITLGRSSLGVGDSTHFQCDLTDFEQAAQCIKRSKPDSILHLAGWNDARSSWEDPLECLRTNVIGTVNLLESIRIHSPHSRIVIIGSALEYSPSRNEQPPHPYSLSKTLQILISESWDQFFQMDVSIVKPTNLIGPGHSNGICSKIAAEIARAERDQSCADLHIQNMNAQCDFLDIRDAIRAYFIVLESDDARKMYEIGTGKSRELKELVAAIGKLTCRPFQIQKGTPQETARVVLDLTPIQRLGWKPLYTFERSLEDILEFQRFILKNE